MKEKNCLGHATPPHIKNTPPTWGEPHSMSGSERKKEGKSIEGVGSKGGRERRDKGGKGGKGIAA